MVSQAFFVGAALSGRPIEKPPPDKRGFRSTELTTKSNLEPTHLTYEHVIPKHRCPPGANGQGRIIAKANKIRAVAQTRRLPFDRLRANGGVLKSFEFPVHAELVEA